MGQIRNKWGGDFIPMPDEIIHQLVAMGRIDETDVVYGDDEPLPDSVPGPSIVPNADVVTQATASDSAKPGKSKNP